MEKEKEKGRGVKIVEGNLEEMVPPALGGKVQKRGTVGAKIKGNQLIRP